MELTIMAATWSTIGWIGMDMYLPALPLMDEAFSTTESMVNATLLAYQATMAIGSLLGGAVSDRLGRRGPLLTGAVLFVVFVAICALAPSIWVLLVARALSGIGAGFVCAIVMAIIKDELEGKELDRAVTITQSLVIVGPVAAPFLGSLAIDLIGWRGIFAFLGILGFLALLWVAPLAETLPPSGRADVSVIGSLGLLVQVARRRDFTVLLVALSAPAFCFGAYMTLCSYIFLDDFGLSYMSYSFCYALTTAVSIAGPFIYLALNRRRSNRVIVVLIAAVLGLDGLLMLLVGPLAAVAFLLTCLPFALMESMARPCAFLVLLRAAEDTAGSASALVSFSIAIFCALGTPAASLPLGTHISTLGWLIFFSALVSLALVVLLRRGFRSHILDDDAQ